MPNFVFRTTYLDRILPKKYINKHHVSIPKSDVSWLLQKGEVTCNLELLDQILMKDKKEFWERI